MLPIIDGHNDVLLRLLQGDAPDARAFFTESQQGQFDFPRAKKGGLAGGFFAIFPPYPQNSPEGDPLWGLTFHETGYRQKPHSAIDPADGRAFTDRAIRLLREIEAASQGSFQVATSLAQLEDSLERGVMAAILHFEGAEAIHADLGNLDDYYQQGLRSLGLVWSRPNVFGSGVPFAFPQDPDTGPGLTPAGRALVQACNQAGILVDLAHLNAKGFWDVQKLSTAPLVVTHADVFSICPSSRNLTDDQILAVGATGGVIGINFETLNTRADGRLESNTPLAQIVRHIDAIVEKIGVDHVALGSDFDGADMPDGLRDVAGLPNLVQALREARYDQEALEKIAYRNWLRVLAQTWGENP